MKWICCQIGAREHYSVPRVLHRHGRLAALYTDYWAGPVTRAVAGRLKTGALRSLAGRYYFELDGAAIVSWNLRSLWWEKILRTPKPANYGKEKLETSGPYHGFIEVGRRFATRVREHLGRRSDLCPDSIFFAYDTGALEAMEWCREHGIKFVLNQMDPNRVEVELVRTEEQQWPGWALSPIQVPDAYFVRREQEWALADRVLVNSDFCLQALLQQGVPAEKLVVVPLCFEGNAETLKTEKLKFNGVSASAPLRVLFLGQVILRKGIQYLIETARLLKDESIHFDVVGPVGISAEAVASAPATVTFHGRSTRDQAGAWYRRADVFVLPTISDGFALTQLEAMANGLPVVTTPCCGDVVSDGVDGFIVPPRDPEALAKALQRYLAEPDLLTNHSAAAGIKAGQFSMERLAANLLALEEGLLRKS